MKKILFTFYLVSLSIFSSAQITVDFTADKTEICLGESIKFTPVVSPSGTVVSSYIWNFGNGQGSNLASPDYVYPAAGTYNVTLTIIVNGQSHDRQRTQYIKVNPLPDAKFSILSTDCEAPFEVTFQNNSSNTGNFSYIWNFGNGQTSTLQSPGPVTYNTDGTYTVTLTVTNLDTGCQKIITDNLVVSPFEAGISAPIEVCAGTPVQFNDNSTIGANSWTWNFGGLGTSNQQNPTFTFTPPGTYTVTLTAQNTLSSCPADQTTHEITVHPLPVAMFTAPITAGCSPLTINFDTSGSSGSGALTFVWNYGDGQTGSDATHTYAANGTYTVSLTVTDENGCSVTFTRTNYIIVQDPTVDFTATPRKGCAPLEVTFTANASSPSGSDPIVEYHWDFNGDGVVDLITTTPNAVNTFPFGKYNVTLTVVTANGCTATITKNKFILAGVEAIIDFERNPDQACIKEPIQFTSSTLSTYGGLPSSSYDPDEIEFEWIFGEFQNNGSIPFPGTGMEDPMWPFPQDTGYMDVTFRVRFRGCETEIIKPDFVYIDPPKSLFSVHDLSTMVPQTVFCDPIFPVSIYANARGNHVDTIAGPIDPENSWPSASILGRANPTYTQFTDDIDVIWRWGDGTTTTFSTDGTGADFSLNANFDENSSYNHSYSQYGSYTIKQVILNHRTGCADSTTQVIHISKITADYTPSNDSVCFNGTLNFDGFGIAPDTIRNTYTPYTYNWTFNGSVTNSVTTTSTLEDPVGIPFNVAPGLYNVVMNITNSIPGNQGCTSSVTKQIRVLELPIANFTPTNAVGCAPLFVDFEADTTSTAYPSGVKLETFTWNYGDGNTDDLGEHTYVTPNNTGTYSATLTVIDEFGCRDTQTYPVEVTMPIPIFSLDPVVCNNEIFTLSPSASQVAGPPQDVTWVIDGSLNVSPSVPGSDTTYFFDETSSNLSEAHTITLSITDRNGCTAIDMLDITVSLPQANYTFIASSNSQGSGASWTCPSVKVNFTDASQSIGSIIGWNWTFGDGNFSIDQSPENLYVFAGVYDLTFTITDQYGCTSDSITAPFLNIDGPNANLIVTSDPDATCNQTFTFEMTDTYNVASWTWVMGDTTTFEGGNPIEYIYKEPGTYIGVLLIRDDKDCEVPIPFTVTSINNGITADFTFTPAPTADLGQLVIFTDQSVSPSPGGIVFWEWKFSDGYFTSNTTGEDVKHVFSQKDSLYITLSVQDAEGCWDEITKSIYIENNLYIPNIFSPNGDGKNDRWYIPGTPFKSYEILIYNRWGSLMHEESNQTDGAEGGLHVKWDGRNKGKGLCSDGTYYFILKGSLLDDTPIEKTGFITLVDGVE